MSHDIPYWPTDAEVAPPPVALAGATPRAAARKGAAGGERDTRGSDHRRDLLSRSGASSGLVRRPPPSRWSSTRLHCALLLLHLYIRRWVEVCETAGQPNVLTERRLYGAAAAMQPAISGPEAAVAAARLPHIARRVFFGPPAPVARVAVAQSIEKITENLRAPEIQWRLAISSVRRL